MGPAKWRPRIQQSGPTALRRSQVTELLQTCVTFIADGQCLFMFYNFNNVLSKIMLTLHVAVKIACNAKMCKKLLIYAIIESLLPEYNSVDSINIITFHTTDPLEHQKQTCTRYSKANYNRCLQSPLSSQHITGALYSGPKIRIDEPQRS